MFKKCTVPMCQNTNRKYPKKIFISIPYDPNRRKLWLQLARREPKFTNDTLLYFCEDHFDMPNDMENYVRYCIMGSVSRIRMKPDCVPSRFECQLKRKPESETEKELVNSRQGYNARQSRAILRSIYARERAIPTASKVVVSKEQHMEISQSKYARERTMPIARKVAISKKQRMEILESIYARERAMPTARKVAISNKQHMEILENIYARERAMMSEASGSNSDIQANTDKDVSSTNFHDQAIKVCPESLLCIINVKVTLFV